MFYSYSLAIKLNKLIRRTKEGLGIKLGLVMF